MASEAAEIKAAFEKYDANKDGVISFDELANVMRACGEFSDDELQEMFQSVDQAGDGKISYCEFVDWVMADDEETGEEAPKNETPAADKAEAESDVETEEAPPDCDDDDEDCDFEEELEDAGFNVNSEEVSRGEWRFVMGKFGIEEDEADDMFDAIAEDNGGEPESGRLPLVDFIRGLGVDPGNTEVLQAIVSTVGEAREAGVSNEKTPEPAEGETKPVSEGRVLIALDRMVRELDFKGLAAEEAPGLKQAKIFSKLEQRALDSLEDGDLVARVKAVQASPPLLNICAGSRSAEERCKTKVKAIIEQCRASGTKFCDPDWDVNFPSSVLYVDKENPGYDCTVDIPAKWMRYSEIVDSPVLVKDKAVPNDIIQGSIGTCFLLGAMGAIVGNDPEILKKLFIIHDFEVGIFGVRFCIEGEWSFVIIDDQMPVRDDGSLIYCGSKDPEEVWAPLIEKAYCKLHTCYEMCDGGLAQEAVYSFCGGVNGIFNITDEHRADPSKYFKKLKGARQRGWMLTTAFDGRPSGGSGKCGEAVLECGLIGGHAYSVIKVKEAEGNQLVCCRNPWGQGEWTGKWGDGNTQDEWTESMDAATGHTNRQDGTFWMSIEDFVGNSAGVEFARAFGPQWKKVTQYSRFQETPMTAKANWAFKARSAEELTLRKGKPVEVTQMSGGWWKGTNASGTGWFPSNYVKLQNRAIAKFKLEGTPGTKVVIALMQPNIMFARKFYRRVEDGLNYKETTCPGMVLCALGSDNQAKFKKSGRKRSMWGELTMDGQPLFVYAMSSEGAATRFSLRVYAQNGDVSINEVAGAQLEEVTAVLGDI